MKEKAAHYSDRVFYVDVSDGVVAAFVVGFVTDDRVIDRGKMYADLMCAAGFDLDLKKGEFIEPLADLPQRKRVAAVCGDGHFCSVPAVAGHRAVE